MSHGFHRSTSQHRPTPPPPDGVVRAWAAFSAGTTPRNTHRTLPWLAQPPSNLQLDSGVGTFSPEASSPGARLSASPAQATGRTPSPATPSIGHRVVRSSPERVKLSGGHRTAARMPGGCHGNAAARQSARLGDAGSRTDGSEGIKSSRRAAAGAPCCCWGSISASSFTVS